MTPHSFSFSMDIMAPAEKVWEALTKPELVKQYFFGTNIETDWTVGGPIFYRGEWQGTAYEDKGTVLEFVPMTRIVINYHSAFSKTPDSPEHYQIISYELSPIEGGTTLSITQSNIPTEEAVVDSTKNWKLVIDGLKKMVEA